MSQRVRQRTKVSTKSARCAMFSWCTIHDSRPDSSRVATSPKYQARLHCFYPDASTSVQRQTGI
jgi:hypothetical protein